MKLETLERSLDHGILLISKTANTTSQVIRNLLGDDGDMLSLYLTKPDRQEGEQVGELD